MSAGMAAIRRCSTPIRLNIFAVRLGWTRCVGCWRRSPIGICHGGEGSSDVHWFVVLGDIRHRAGVWGLGAHGQRSGLLEQLQRVGLRRVVVPARLAGFRLRYSGVTFHDEVVVSRVAW